MASLNDKQEMFCLEYIKDLNATQAAIRAGYSEKTANRTGSKLLSKADIAQKIAELKDRRSDQTAIDANWVLIKAKESFEFNSQEVYDSEGNPKMVNATAASKFLELCGKHVNVSAFSKEQEQTNQQPITINLTEAKKPDAD